MMRTNSERALGWLRYGLPGLVIGVGLAWGLGGRGPTALAQDPRGLGAFAPPSSASERARSAEAAGTGTIAMTTSAGGTAQFLYLIDTQSKALAVYRVDPSNPKGSVKLEAVRQYQWDLKLAEYNCLPPEVSAIETTVRNLGRQTKP